VSARLLILEAGTAPSNNLMRSLSAGDGSLTLVGCNVSRFTLKKSTARRNYLLPATTRDYLSALRRIIRAERIDLVLPTSDADVLILGKLRQRIGCRTFLPSNSAIARCQDKYALTRLLRSKKIPAPLTYRVRGHRDVDGVFRRFRGHDRLWCRIRTGSGSLGAIPVRTPDQVRGWMAFWEGMRSVPPGSFTLSEYLDGRDYCVQSIWKDGSLVLAKMAERILYIDTGSPSGRSSMPSLAKTVHDSEAIDVASRAIRALDRRASGVFFVDMKERKPGEPCVTEINAGRFATMTNIHDLTGKYNMALTFVRVALGEDVRIPNAYDFDEGRYLVRSVDTLPVIVTKDQLFRGIRTVMD
jgi:carbamoyl-phosphate synthase large subunit